EAFSNRQTSEGHTQSGSGRFSHLSINQGRLGIGRITGLDHPRLAHFQPQVIAFTGTLAYTRKHGISAMLLGHIVDELHDDHGLAYARAAEQTDLSALQ